MKNFTIFRCRPGSLRLTLGASLALVLLAPACRGDRDIEKPTPLFTESPVEYPLELWDQDIEGSTLVRVLVNKSGGVDSVMVVESSGHDALDSAAVRGALEMEFEPATEEGEPVRVWARVPVYFSKGEQPGEAGRPPATEGGNSAGSSASSPGFQGLRR